MIFEKLKREIVNINDNDPVFIYIGIGTAIGQLTAENVLENCNYHQFPPFLQHIKNVLPNVRLFVMLIDPRQEDPPYMVNDYHLLNEKDDKDHYISQDTRLQVFVLRENVYTDTDIHINNDKHINITNHLRDLNNFSIEHNASLLYHDFTGRRLAEIAEYFDDEYKERLDQIVYGLSAREDHGCYFDLTICTSYFPIRLDYNDKGRPIIKMFNYFYYMLNNKINKIQEDIHKYDNNMSIMDMNIKDVCELQKKQILTDNIYRFKNNNMSMLRQIGKFIQEDAEKEGICIANNANNANNERCKDYYFIFNCISNSEQRKLYLELFEKNEYKLLYQLIFEYCANQLKPIVQLKELDITCEELLTFITLDKDPYKWNNTISQFI